MDRSINVYFVFRYMIKHWLVMLICGIVLALAAGGLYFFLQKSGSQSDTLNVENDPEVLYNQLTKDEIERVNYALFLNSKLNEIQQYLDSSVLFKKNAYDINKFNIQYQIRLNDAQKFTPEERTELYCKLLVSYGNYFNSGSAAMELIDRYYKNDEITQTQLDDMIDLGYDSQTVGSGTFVINVIEPSSVKNILENLQILMDECNKKFSEKIIKHSLVVINSSNSNNRNDGIADLQERVRARYDATKNSIRMMKVNGELSDNAMSYYDEIVGEKGYHFDSGYNLEETSSGFSKREALKYALSGGFIGVFLSGVFLILYYLLFVFGKYVVSPDDFTRNMHIKYMGNLDNRNLVKLIASKIKGYCDDHDINRIALISSEDKLIQDDAVRYLTNNLESKGVEAVTLKDVNSDSRDLDALLEIRHCLVIERVNYSYYGQVYDLVAMMKDNDINIIGAVEL